VSDEEKNKALVRRLIEEVDNRGNLDVADELLAPNFVDHDVVPQEDAGIQGYKRAVAEQRAASSDLHFSIEEQIAEGEKVVTRYIGSGTVDQEEYEGIPPTGVRITIENITINRVVEGKIVEERTVSDTSPLWEQRVEQERIERARRAGAASGEAHPTCPAPKGRARPRWLADLSALPAGTRGGRRLLRLPAPGGR
jgi:predicted ester cyclase